MHLPSGRPRFQLDVPGTPDEVIKTIQTMLGADDAPCVGLVAELHHHFDLRIKPEDHHLWSPHLSANVFEGEDGGSNISALIGPNPNIWTAVAFSYLASFTGLLFFLTLGSVQLSMDENPWGFYACGVLLLFAGIVRAVSKFGERLAADQILLLRQTLHRTFQNP